MVKRYFDVNVFVYFLTHHHQYFERSNYWFSNTEEFYNRKPRPLGQEGGQTSEIVLFQLIVILSKILLDKSPIEILSALFSFLVKWGIRFVHLEPNEIEKVKDVAVNYNLDFEDAIHFYLSKKLEN